MEIRLLTAVGPVADQTARAIKDLVITCTKATGVAPVSEQPLLHLQDPRAHVAHILAIQENALVGYAQADLSNPTEVSLELAVAPSERDTGLDCRLLEAGGYVAQQNNAAYSVWLHGPSTQFISMFQANNFHLTRSLERRRLLLTNKNLTTPPHALGENQTKPEHVNPDESLQSTFEIRTFQPGPDNEKWVRANAQAFSWHPEQGKLTLEDLHQRMQEPWFNAELFFVVDSTQNPGELDGFAWVKALPQDTTGEIYVIATSPNTRGQGLGRKLLNTALTALQERGYTQVDLYVESTNTAAIALYDHIGFKEIELHVKLTRPATPPTE